MNQDEQCYSCPLDPKPHRLTMWCGLARLGIHSAEDLRKRFDDIKAEGKHASRKG